MSVLGAGIGPVVAMVGFHLGGDPTALLLGLVMALGAVLPVGFLAHGPRWRSALAAALGSLAGGVAFVQLLAP